MQGLNKQLFILYVHTRMHVSDLYYSVSTTIRRLLHAVLPSFQRVPYQLYADTSAGICDERLQCRDTKIEISDEELFQFR